jgi:1-acyl-sn-glycerol-3-phosphate acyltransferase
VNQEASAHRADAERLAGSLALWLRATAFYAGLGACTAVCALAALSMAALPYRFRYAAVAAWATFNLWWLKTTCNLAYRVEGAEHIPGTPSVVLCKHQSAWETLALNMLFRPQVWVLKEELLKIPVFGWGLATLRPIAIDRKAGLSAIEQVLRQGTVRLRAGCWVVVFPEGTRVAPGDRQRYKGGGARLAAHTGLPVVPVAHNAGDYWPRRSFVKLPGVIRLVVGPTIATEARTALEINREAEAWIESTVARLREEAGFTMRGDGAWSG